MIARNFLTIASLLTMVIGVVPTTRAQEYPTRPIRLLVGFAPGGSADILARILGRKLGEQFKQQIIVDNRPGAETTIASNITAKAVPDGYTLVAVSASHAVNVGLFKKLPYDPVKDFAAVTLVASVPSVLVATPSLPAKHVSDLIEMARAKPAQLSFASSGSLTYLSGELLKSMANINLTHVPYKGTALAFPDVFSGRVQLLFSSVLAVLPQIKASRLKPIGITSAERSVALPEVPTIAESGLVGYEATNWTGVLAPAATSKPIVGKLNAEILRALRSADVIEAIVQQGADPRSSTPGEFESYLKAEIAKWTKVTRGTGIVAE